MMTKILDLLKEHDWNTLSTKSYSKEPYTEEEIKAVTSLEQEAGNYISNRCYQLATIGEMMAICSSEKEIGGFEKDEVTMMGYFFKSELETMGVMVELLADAGFHKAKALEKSKGENDD